MKTFRIFTIACLSGLTGALCAAEGNGIPQIPAGQTSVTTVACGSIAERYAEEPGVADSAHYEYFNPITGKLISSIPHGRGPAVQQRPAPLTECLKNQPAKQ